MVGELFSSSPDGIGVTALDRPEGHVSSVEGFLWLGPDVRHVSPKEQDGRNPAPDPHVLVKEKLHGTTGDQDPGGIAFTAGFARAESLNHANLAPRLSNMESFCNASTGQDSVPLEIC